MQCMYSISMDEEQTLSVARREIQIVFGAQTKLKNANIGKWRIVKSNPCRLNYFHEITATLPLMHYRYTYLLTYLLHCGSLLTS